MSASNNRNKEHDTVHHLMSRIAHRVRFLAEDERNDFIEYVRRVTEFSGLKIIGWCIMMNHFHLFVYLPKPIEVEEMEILRRYGVLKGRVRRENLECRFAHWRLSGEAGERLVQLELARLRRRMYDVGAYMKGIKQWFSEDYNHRTEHRGTMWESVYRDVVIPKTMSDMSQVLAYIHLNPIRAAITDRFDGYVWSSYTAFRRGDTMAIEGLRFVYGDEISCDELAGIHERIMREALEAERRRRAEKIARTRAAGVEMPCDHLTNEAMVAQAAAHVEVVRRNLVSFHEERRRVADRNEAKELAVRQICDLLAKEGPLAQKEIAGRLSLSERTTRRYLEELCKNGMVCRESRFSPWSLVV